MLEIAPGSLLISVPDLPDFVPVSLTTDDSDAPGGTDFIPDTITVYDYGTVTMYPAGVVETPHAPQVPEGSLTWLLLIALCGILYYRVRTQRL